MRLAFWRRNEDKAEIRRPAEKPAPASAATRADPAMPAMVGDIDLRALGEALRRKRNWIIVPTLFALVLSVAIVNVITPRYKSEARILIDGRENVFLRPNGERNDDRTALDPEAVTSQVQLVLSRDLARDVIKKNRLAELPEFDPLLRGVSPLRRLAALFGIGRDPYSMTPEERVLDSYFDRLTAYAVDKSRVIVVEFQSHDPELASRVANSIAQGYLVLQQNAKQQQAKAASQWLAGEIDSLRQKVAEAEARVEEFRSKSSLFIGTNNTPLSNQQLGEVNTQLNNARALKSDAEAKARLIREMLQSGKPLEASEVLNSELMRRLTEQRVALRAQLAEQSSTLLDNHPRIKELKAQLADLDHQIRDEAVKIARSLENDARIASARVDSLSASLDQMKKQASSSNGEDVRLRALEREAKAERDLLESYLAKYREATTRETIDTTPTDGRIISPGIVSNTPAYPKKLPIVLISTLAMLMLSSGVIVTGELLRMTAPRAVAAASRIAFAPAGEAVVEPATATAPPLAPAVAEKTAEPVQPVERFEPIEPAFEPLDSPSELVDPSLEPVEPASGRSEIERLAETLSAAGEAGRKITVLGTAGGESITLTALTLARLLARNVRVVVVDLAASSPMFHATSVDPVAPGMAELMQGEASFSQIITRDRLSRVQLVSAGRPGFDRSLLQSPRLVLAIDALLRVYDHVLIDAGMASDLPAELLTANARAVVVPDATMPAEARKLMCEQLKAVGFGEVTMLSRPAEPSDAADVAAPRVVAA